MSIPTLPSGESTLRGSNLHPTRWQTRVPRAPLSKSFESGTDIPLNRGLREVGARQQHALGVADGRHSVARLPAEPRPVGWGPSAPYFEHTQAATVHAFPAAARQAARLRSSASFLVLPRPGLTSRCVVSAMAPHCSTKFTTIWQSGARRAQ